MPHYYTNDEGISDPSILTFNYKGHKITLKSDHGVFSRNRVDYGSRVLLDTVSLDGVSKLLDVGCGYGPMGISLKMSQFDVLVDMIDINKRAVGLANEGIELNHLTGIKAYVSDRYEAVNDTYDLIVSNPPIRAGKDVVSAIISESVHYLNTNGRLVIVIQKKQGAPSAKKLMETTFGNVEILKRDKGYYILQSKKNTA